jgi:hypothetical protein
VISYTFDRESIMLGEDTQANPLFSTRSADWCTTSTKSYSPSHATWAFLGDGPPICFLQRIEDALLRVPDKEALPDATPVIKSS